MSESPQSAYRSSLYERYATTHYAPAAGLTDKLSLYRAKQYSRYFGPYLPADKAAHILEVGCGDGSFLLCCQQHGYSQVKAIDISPEQVEICHQKGFQQVVCADINSYFTTQTDSLDCVVMSDVLEHLSKPEVIQTLKAIFQHLKPGGKLIVRVPNLSNPFNLKTQFGDFTHETGFTQSSLQQVFQVAGFQVETVHGEFSEHANRWKRLWYDQIVWNAFQAFLKNTMHLTTEVVRGKNLIAVGFKAASKIS
ncbi:class I SAM-dependent methyltransferase [Almyronema epifaneia]|uniref:Class I SAM-dependent methyltransferase n=1 Tax=Almyronema epifaneia S1 TaxID=2991925 RepID=A0ABW6II97_9CYAN